MSWVSQEEKVSVEGYPNKRGLTSQRSNAINCYKIGHFKRYCHERKDNDDFVQVVVALNEDGYESVMALVASSLETKDTWVLDEVFSYHICPRK